MNAGAQEPQIDFTVNTSNLYKEENITDLNVASIRKLTPIKPDGTKDDSRTELFYGHTQLVSPQGPVPLHASLQANNITEAIAVFPTAMKEALDKMVERIKQQQQEQQQKKEQEKPQDKPE